MINLACGLSVDLAEEERLRLAVALPATSGWGTAAGDFEPF